MTEQEAVAQVNELLNDARNALQKAYRIANNHDLGLNMDPIMGAVSDLDVRVNPDLYETSSDSSWGYDSSHG